VPSLLIDDSVNLPEVSFRCKCGENVETKKYSDKDVSLKIIGTFSSRYLTSDYYKSLSIDLVSRQCISSSKTKMNFNSGTNSCYYRDEKLFMYR
jgi:hypothetical protein